VEMKELQKEIKESTISSGSVKRLYSPFMGIIYCTYQNITLIMSMCTFSTEILPRAQQKEDLLLSVHIPKGLDAVSVSD